MIIYLLNWKRHFEDLSTLLLLIKSSRMGMSLGPRGDYSLRYRGLLGWDLAEHSSLLDVCSCFLSRVLQTYWVMMFHGLEGTK